MTFCHGLKLPALYGRIWELIEKAALDLFKGGSRGRCFLTSKFAKFLEEQLMPPPHDVPKMMAELIVWLRSEHGINPVLESGIAQFQLVHIHPFIDGDGRSSRLLSTLCLYRKGYDFKRLFTISEYYDRNRAPFYRALQSVRENKLDITCWLEYFVEGLATQMREVQERGEIVIRRDVTLVRARKAGIKDRQLSLLSFILKKGRGTLAECEAALKENRRTLQRDLKMLTDKSFLREVGSGPTDPTKFYEPLL